MTVRELDERMDHFEFVQWAALDTIRGQEAEEAERRAKKGMRMTPFRRRR